MVYQASNPFSTRFTRPGCIESLDVNGVHVDLGLLVDRLERLGGMGAIVGPHGSGKSTLLAHLSAEVVRRGGCAPRIRLHSWRDATAVWRAIRRAPRRATVCVDSWECLGLPARWLLRLVASASGRGLLVTSHGGCGLPVLSRCDTSVGLLHAIVGRLPNRGLWSGKLIDSTDVEETFTRHRGNLREALYELYDRFEVRLRGLPMGGDHDDREGGAGRAGGRHQIHEFAAGFSYAGAPERNLG